MRLRNNSKAKIKEINCLEILIMKGIFKMVDKTIIDGIDVSKCNMFRDDVFTDKQLNNVCSIGLWQRDYSGLEEFCKMSCDCKSNPNCHFKQLARAKKENEEFKEKLSQAKAITEPLNSELPEDKVIREIFLMVNDCINQKVNHYKHALDEIEHQVTELFLGVENKDRTYCEKILDIINSVKDKNVPHKAKEGE